MPFVLDFSLYSLSSLPYFVGGDPTLPSLNYSPKPNIYYLWAVVLVMPRPEQIPIQKHTTQEELQKRIKTLETNTKILQRLYFIKHRYDGESVEEASRLVGVAKPVGYAWQKRWNESGYDGLIPRYAGGRPSKLTDQQKEKLQLLLKEKDIWTTEDVRLLILNEFDVDYTLKQVRIIAKKFGMKYAKPFAFDYRKPPDAEQILKKLTKD